MRAAVLHGRGDLRVETLPVPRPGPGEVLLAVGTVGLCGTDASEYGRGPRMFPIEARHPVTGHLGPMVIGPEFGGRVVALGPDVDPSWLDQEVASCGAVSCGRCDWCSRGRTNLCVAYSAVGLHRPGALAEYVVTPVANCAQVGGRGLPPDAAALGQPMSIAVHARRRGRVQPDERVVVLGAGGIGAFLVHAIHAVGARVVAVDALSQRLTLARSLGADAALLAQSATAAGIEEALGGPPHVIFEATGRAAALALALELLSPGGRLVQVGLHAEPAALDLRRLSLTELEIIGTNAMVRATDFEEALDLVASRREGWADVAPIALPLQDVATQGLAQLGAGPAEVVKFLIDPRAREQRPSDTTPR
jgi:(R,R)-butanediol dehydrogenase/meso-butanediol dehydrogenase/diacetyl reductase